MSIKPCPFCGKQPHIETIQETEKLERSVIICKTGYCISPKCSLVMPIGKSYQTAVRWWNRRQAE